MELAPRAPEDEVEHSVIGSAAGGSQGNSESATNAVSVSAARVKMRRHRVVLSCKPCHLHKQKCDRQLPCTRCIKRGDPGLCMYDNAPSGSMLRPSVSENIDLAQRIAQLESLVQASFGGQVSPADFRSSSTGGSSSPNRVPDASAVQVAAAALGELSQQQDRMQGVENYQHSTSKSTPVLGSILPPRAAMEELLTFFFDSSSFPWIWHVLHRQIFDRSYLAFAARPEPSGTDFEALLSAVCASSIQLMPERHQRSSAFLKDANETYSLKTRLIDHSRSILYAVNDRPCSIERVQCLVLLTIFYLNEGNFWLCYNLIGTAIRGAQFLGLHRDPTALWSRMEQFEIEVRRRLWAGLVIFDRKIAVLLKRPYLLNDNQCTVLPPANSDEETIASNSTVSLKSLSEITSHTFHILQLNLSKSLRRISDECFGSIRPSYSIILSIERQVLEFEERIPPAFVNPYITSSHQILSTIAPHIQGRMLLLDVCYARLLLTRYFAFSAIADVQNQGLTKDQESIIKFDRSARSLCVANCKRLISAVLIALHEWKIDFSQCLRWSLLSLYTFDAALSLAICTFGPFDDDSGNSFAWISLAGSLLKELGSEDSLITKNANTLVEVLLARLREAVQGGNSPRSLSTWSATEGLDVASSTLRDKQPSMDELLKECRDCDALWLTTTTSVYEAYYPGPEVVSALDVPAFEHFMTRCIPR